MTDMLFPTDGRPLPGLPEHVVDALRDQSRAVRARTGFSGWFHVPTGCVQWHAGDEPRGAPHMDVVVQGDSYMPLDVEHTVERIMVSANKSWDAKVRDVERDKSQKRADAKKTISDRVWDTMPEFMERLKYHTRTMDNKHSKRVFHVEHSLSGQ